MTEDKTENIMAEVDIKDLGDDKDAIEFIRSLAGSKPEVKEEEDKKESTEIPKDKTFEETSSIHNLQSKLIEDIDSVTLDDISSSEKDMFLKSILHDTPIVLNVSIFNNMVNSVIKARTVYEQNIIMRIVNKDEKYESLPEYVGRLQELSAAIMLKEFSGKKFEPPVLDINKEDKYNANVLVDYTRNMMGSLNTYKWQAIIRSINIFELKCQLLLTSCNDRNFWSPPDQD